MSTQVEEKIVEDYKKYDAQYAKKWGMEITGNRFMHEGKCQYVDNLIKTTFSDLSTLKVIDMGCGLGHELARLKDLGLQSHNLFGLDINEERILKAKDSYQDITFNMMSALDTGYEDGSFDIIMLYTVFSSIPDYNLKLKIAQEMRRLLSKNGIIIIYDMRYPNPSNKSINPLRLSQVEKLFDGMHIQSQSITLIPQIARQLSNRCAYNLLHSIPIMRSHAFYVIRHKTS